MDLLAQVQAWVKQNFWRKRDHVDASTGTNDAGLPVVLNTLGRLGITLLTPLVGTLTIIGDFAVGTSTFLAGAFGVAKVQFDKTSNGTLLFHRESADTGGPTLEFLKRRSGWNAVSNGDRLGSIGFSAADGVDAANAVQIYVEVDGTPGSNDMPGRVIIAVSPDGSAAVVTAMTISNTRRAQFAGEVVMIGTTSETALGVDGIRFGNVSGSPRMILEDAGFTQWQMDNNAGTWRVFIPGGVKLSHDGTTFTVTGNLAVTGNFGAWTNLSYGTGWGDYNAASWQRGQYRKIGDMVYLRGLVARTSGVGTTIATLPAGHYPPVQILNQVNGTDAHARVDITAGGVMVLAVGTPTHISLNDIPPFSVI